MDNEYLEINGQKYEVNCKGYLVDPLQWDEQVRDHFAREEKIELTDNHHRVLELIRIFYLKNKWTSRGESHHQRYGGNFRS